MVKFVCEIDLKLAMSGHGKGKRQRADPAKPDYSSHVYSIILIHQGRESMNALDEWCRFLAVPATCVVNIC